MALKISMGDKMGTFVQVCDGQHLWTYRQLLDDGKLSRVDLDRVAKVLEEGRGENAAPGPLVAGPVGAGGLAGMLRALLRSFRFEVKGQATLPGTPVWQLRGTWRPERLAQILPSQKDAIQQGRGVELGQLPPHLPDHVILLLGKEDLFPYRFEYRRTLPGKQGGSPPESRAIVTLQLHEVSVNVPIDPSHFRYNPSNLEFSDETQRFLRAVEGQP